MHTNLVYFLISYNYMRYILWSYHVILVLLNTTNKSSFSKKKSSKIFYLYTLWLDDKSRTYYSIPAFALLPFLFLSRVFYFLLISLADLLNHWMFFCPKSPLPQVFFVVLLFLCYSLLIYHGVLLRYLTKEG
jgi:hypothetical protein